MKPPYTLVPSLPPRDLSLVKRYHLGSPANLNTKRPRNHLPRRTRTPIYPPIALAVLFPL